MSSFSFIFRFFHYLSRSVTAHGLHSPFMYRLMTEAINGRTGKAEVNLPEQLRRELLHSDETIRVNDLGGGSRLTPGNTRKVRQIARYSARRKRPGKLLYRLVKHFNPAVVVELGTSFGIGTLFLKAAVPHAHIITIEGCEATAGIAKRNISKYGASDVEVIQGSFADILSPSFIANANPGVVLFDGDHRCESTLDYFNRFTAFAGNDTVFIFDDIHWSAEMEQAWEIIKSDRRVRVTIDLFTFGLVLFRKEMSRQHFVLRNYDCF